MNRITRHLLYYFYVIILTMTLAGCKSTLVPKSADDTQTGSSLLSLLVEQPQATELTARLAVTLSDMKGTGQLKMRWNHSVQISVNLLGMMEVARIEFLPDHILIIDRINRRYCTAHYAELPYRNITGLDFYAVQAIFWNRAFAPGYQTPRDALFHLEESSPLVKTIGNTATEALSAQSVARNTEKVYVNQEYKYYFYSDARGNLLRTSKRGTEFSLAVDYSNRTLVDQTTTLPAMWSIELTGADELTNIIVELSNISTAIGTWADESTVSSKYSKVTISQLIETLDL